MIVFHTIAVGNETGSEHTPFCNIRKQWLRVDDQMKNSETNVLRHWAGVAMTRLAKCAENNGHCVEG